MTALADRQKEFCSYFLSDYPMRSAAAIGGNATQENQCRPVTIGPKDHGSDGALQWRAERLDESSEGLKPWAAAKGIPWDTLKSQARFTMYELDQDKYRSLKADLKLGTKSLETLTLNFCDEFERPSLTGRAPDFRIGYAHDCLAILMRDVPVVVAGPVPAPPPVPSIPVGDFQMPIELILQLVAPLAESLVTGLLKGALTHAIPPVMTTPAPAPTKSVLTEADFAKIAEMIAAALAALQQPKPAA